MTSRNGMGELKEYLAGVTEALDGIVAHLHVVTQAHFLCILLFDIVRSCDVTNFFSLFSESQKPNNDNERLGRTGK